MNSTATEPHSIENAEKSRLAVVEVHTSGSGKENKGRDGCEYSFSTNETYQKRLGTIIRNKTKKATVKKGDKTLTAKEVRERKATSKEHSSSVSQSILLEKGGRSIELGRSRKVIASITGSNPSSPDEANEKRLEKVTFVNSNKSRVENGGTALTIEKTREDTISSKKNSSEVTHRVQLEKGDRRLKLKHSRELTALPGETRTTVEDKRSYQAGDRKWKESKTAVHKTFSFGAKESISAHSESKSIGDTKWTTENVNKQSVKALGKKTISDSTSYKTKTGDRSKTISDTTSNTFSFFGNKKTVSHSDSWSHKTGDTTNKTTEESSHTDSKGFLGFGKKERDSHSISHVKKIGDTKHTTTDESSYTKPKGIFSFNTTESHTHTESQAKKIGKKLVEDEETSSFTKSFFGGTETSHIKEHSETTKTDKGQVTETTADKVSHSAMDGTTTSHTHAVKTVKDGISKTKATSHSLNKNVGMTTYSYEKTNMKTHKSGIKTGSRTSVSVSSSLPFIQKLLEKKTKSSVSPGVTAPKNEQKSLPTPQKSSSSSSKSKK